MKRKAILIYKKNEFEGIPVSISFGKRSKVTTSSPILICDVVVERRKTVHYGGKFKGWYRTRF